MFTQIGLARPFPDGGAVVELDVMAFLTTTPNEVVRAIHPNRMPVILSPDDYDTWLTGDPGDSLALAKPLPSDEREIKTTSDKKDEPQAA